MLLEYALSGGTRTLFDNQSDILAGEMINSLDIYIESEGSLYEYTQAQMLQLLLENYPHLVHLSIHFSDTWYEFKSPVKKPSDYIKDYKNTVHSALTADNINQATIKNSTLAPKLINIISSKLSNIETLQCIDCNLVFDVDFYAILELQNFRKLSHLNLQISNIILDRFHLVYILFVNDGETKHYMDRREVQQKVYKLLPVSCKYIQECKGLSSITETSFITIQCGNITKLTLKDTSSEFTCELLP